MKITPTALPGVLVIEPVVFKDDRGSFFEMFRDDRWAEHGLPTTFRQDNQSRSKRDVLRGLHYQLRHPQGKLVTCSAGRLFDVAVDIRLGSPTFGQWTGIELAADNPRLLWIPPGFAHGFYVLADDTVMAYKCTDVYVQSDDRGILWSDPDLQISWPGTNPLLSRKDRELPTLKAARPNLPLYSAGFAAQPAR